jgi:valyl-tRNA synthetase
MMKLFNTVKAFRSQIASYKIQGNAKPHIIVQTSNPEMHQIFKQELAVVQSLVKAGETGVISADEQPPAGCLKGFVSDEISIYVKVVGLIDIKVENDRIEKRMKQLDGFKEALVKKMSIPDYDKKVPANVQAENNEKMNVLDTEFAELNKQLAELKQIMQ